MFSFCSCVIIGEQVPSALARAAFNLVNVDVLPQKGLNVYDLLRRDVVAISVDAIPYIENELLKDI